MSAATVVNGTIVRHDSIVKADLIVEDGIITEVQQPGRAVPRGTIIDATGLYVLPGAVDVHVHCRAPAYPARGDFATETRAAAAGGVTTILEMPISKPSTSTVAVLEARKALAERTAYVDFGLYAAPGAMDPQEIKGMVEAGAIGFKTFMTAAPEGRDDEFGGLCVTNEPQLLELLEIIQPYNLPSVFHAENNLLLEYFEARMRATGRLDVQAHVESRPPVTESTAIALLLAMAREVGGRVHIAHLSTAAGAELIRDARRRGIRVTTEVCVHHLLFTADKLAEIGPFGKIHPPLRSQEDVDAMWTALEDGTIDLITTDHSPFSLAEKERGYENIWLAPPGVPSLEVLYPFVLDQAQRGRFSLSRAVELVSTRPAQLYNLYPRKGALEVGADADIVLFDPATEQKVDGSKWFSKAAPIERLYTGRTFQGQIRQTLLRGKPIFRDGQIVGASGDGAFVRPLSAAPSREPVEPVTAG